jgi:hypothetical protein
LGGGATAIGVELPRERVCIVEDEHKKSWKVVVRVEQLRGAVVTTNDERCFLVMLRLKDF